MQHYVKEGGLHEKQSNVISHWHQLIENFQTSSLGFYQSVEAAIKTRQVPESNQTRVEHKEGGLASANREYLRLQRGKYAFDSVPRRSARASSFRGGSRSRRSRSDSSTRSHSSWAS